MIKSIIGNLFVAAFSLGVFGWFLGIVEFIATGLMNKFVFSIGKKVIDIEESPSFATGNFVVDRVFETDNGKFKFVSDKRCVFRDKMRWFSLRIHTPFPLKGSLEFKDGVTKFEGRLPIGTTLFFSAWLAGWTLGCVGLAMQDSSYVIPVIMLVVGWGFAGVLLLTSIATEKKRLLVVYDEVKQQLRY